MKKHFKNIGKLLLELLFTLIGIPIFILVFICGIFYTFFKHVIKFDYSIVQQTQPLLRSINLTFDGLANAGKKWTGSCDGDTCIGQGRRAEDPYYCHDGQYDAGGQGKSPGCGHEWFYS